MSRHWPYLSIIIGSLGVTIIDRAGKILASQFPSPRGFLVGDCLQFASTLNPGIAFGLPLPLGVTLLIHGGILIGLVVALGYWWRRDRLAAAWLLAAGLGAVSNMLDRLAVGAVIDYLSVCHLGSFNIADGLIVVGVLMFVVRRLSSSSRT